VRFLAVLGRLIRFFDQALKKPFQVGGSLVAAVFNDMGFLSERQGVQPLGKRLASIGTEHHDLAPVVGILHPIHKGLGHHPVNHLGQGRMIEEHSFRKFSHRMTLANRHTLLAKARIQLTIDFPVRLREQIGQVFGDRLAVRFRFRHGFGLCVDDGDEYSVALPVLYARDSLNIQYFPLEYFSLDGEAAGCRVNKG
jgi:hypothetical protein